MKFKKDKPETAAQQPEETADVGEREVATAPAREVRNEPRIPRAVRLAQAALKAFSRANPRAKPVRVRRAWPGVTVGQHVVLRPDHEKRLIKAGFVEAINA